MSIISKNTQIPDMYVLRHKHDSNSDDFCYNYSDNLMKNSLSPVVYKNNNNEKVLDKINDMMVTIFDSILPVRNLFFYTHEKIYNKHGRK
jgi:hypothetical protein